jgi:hypothetical protein
MLVRAMGLAERYLPRDQALEVAHEVASEMLRLPADRVTGTLLYIAVTNRLRPHARAARRRTAAEGAYGEKWSTAIPAWVEPGAEALPGSWGSAGSSNCARLPPIGPAELPDSLPAFDAGALRADADNRLWIQARSLTPIPGGPVYDIVSRQGELIDRVQLPAGRPLLGFGRGGIVYLTTATSPVLRVEKALFR